MVSAFTVTILSLAGIIAAIPGVQTMLKVHAEELEDRVELLIATAVNRTRYYAANVILALADPALYVLVAGVLIALLASGANIGISFGNTVLQAMATVPAVWTVVAVPVMVVGVRPAVSLVAWLGVLASFVLTLLGPTFGLADWVLGLSPFWHVPNLQAAHPDLAGLLWISLFTTAFLALVFTGFRRRDLAR
jgi:ABC-2 type transport system permease protein